MKRILTLTLALVMLLAFSSCTKKTTDNGSGTGDMPDIVTGSITFEGYGTMKFELYLDKAPNSCLNFIRVAKSGFYEGVIVHRLIKDFVVQFGGFTDGFIQKQGGDQYRIDGEFSENGFNNPIPHGTGVLSWARTTNPNSATTQIFICTSNNANVTGLDNKYAAFGKITEGLDILAELNNQPTSVQMTPYGLMQDVPETVITITNVTIDSDYPFPAPAK